jgi:hypothetical protein
MEGRSKGREKDGGFELGLQEIIIMDYDCILKPPS